MYEEPKQLICDALCQALKLTRDARDLLRIEYHTEKHEELAILVFDSENTVPVNVTMDSGTAMIRDIMKHLS